MEKIQSFLQENVSFSYKDVLTVIVILLLYGILSFYKLGDTYSPNTFLKVNQKEEIIINFKELTRIDKMMIYIGEENAKFEIYVSTDNKEYIFHSKMNSRGVFTWNKVNLNTDTKYIKLKSLQNSYIGELAFIDSNEEKIPYSSTNKYINDESNYVPKRVSYMNSTYFDEVYFARTAYEYVQGMKIYEWTHPPLGKIIQAIPIYLTHNFNPFLYRLMGNIAGILMLLVLYIFGAVLYKKRIYAILASLIMAFDTFHFAHTRMGTVDSHLVLFIMTSVLMMVIYLKNNKAKYLALSGLFFGLSIGVKWTGFYAGLGLAILYFYDFIKNKKNIIKSIIQGISFFVIIPVFLYCLWFFLFPNNLYKTNNIKNIIKENEAMYNYHSKLEATHFFSSPWYSWPISYKPVWYHQQDIDSKTEETISGVGNLFIWISGILAFFYTVYTEIKNKDKNSWILIIISLSLWLPYIFIGRVMFLYHYFPVLPFLMIMIVNLLKDIKEKLKAEFIIPIYLCSIILFFITYYPVVSGMPISKNYANDIKIFDSWYF